MSSQTPMLHHSDCSFGLNLLLVHQDFCQGSGFKASLQVSQSLYLSSPSMLIEISKPTNPLPTRIPPKMSPQTGTLPPLRPLVRCLTNSCFKQNQCSSRNPRQYRDSHYHFPQPTSSRPPTLCSVCQIMSAARTSGTPLRSKHKWQGRERRFRCRTPYHCLFPGNTYGQALTITRCPRRRKCPQACRTSSFMDRTHSQSPSRWSIAPQD